MDFGPIDMLKMKENDLIFYDIKEHEEKNLISTVYIPKDLIPTLGMEFETEEADYKFYLPYAKVLDLVLKWVESINTKKMTGCSTEFFVVLVKEKRDVNVKYLCHETRCNYLAKMKISRQ